MGEDKWTRQEPGSISGSFVPPPVAREEQTPSRPPLPRRRPRSDRRGGHAPGVDGGELPVTYSPADSSQARDASPDARGLGALGTESVSVAPSPAEQRRLRLAESAKSAESAESAESAQSQATVTSPQLPDNVRYLFTPVLNQPAPAAPAESVGEAAPETQKAGGRRPAAAFQQTATAPATAAAAPAKPAADRLDRRAQAPAQAPDPAPDAAPAPAAAPKPVAPLRKHLAWAAAVFLIVATAVSTAFALVNGGPSTNQVRPASAGSNSGQQGGRTAVTGAKALGGLSRAGITRARAARWIIKEVSPSAIVACDAVMCNQLINEGMRASDLLVLGPAASDPLGADIVVGTPALRSQFGSRLALVYAPSVLASFGRGPARIDIRVVAPDGAAAYQQALNQDLENRQHYGDILLSNSKITVAPEAKPDVVSGLVDPRLLSMLPVLATQHPIQILGFFDRAPGAGVGIPLSGVELAGSDGASGLSAASYQRWLLGFLRDQRAPYLAASITKAVAHGRDVIFVRFSYPSPIGLLSGQ